MAIEGSSFDGSTDYNNDGVPDLAVSNTGFDPNVDNQYTNAGAVYVYLGFDDDVYRKQLWYSYRI